MDLRRYTSDTNCRLRPYESELVKAKRQSTLKLGLTERKRSKDAPTRSALRLAFLNLVVLVEISFNLCICPVGFLLRTDFYN